MPGQKSNETEKELKETTTHFQLYQQFIIWREKKNKENNNYDRRQSFFLLNFFFFLYRFISTHRHTYPTWPDHGLVIVIHTFSHYNLIEPSVIELSLVYILSCGYVYIVYTYYLPQICWVCHCRCHYARTNRTIEIIFSEWNCIKWKANKVT